MKSALGSILGALMLIGLPSELAAQAQDTPCEVPDYLLATDSSVSRVSEGIKSDRPLDILVVGSRSSTLSGAEGSAYPSQLREALREKLPSVTVNLSVELQLKKTAEEVAGGLLKLVEDKQPVLVIWQTGTVDALRSIDPDDFRGAVEKGVTALQNAGVDVVLMNLQYSPRTETMISPAPYVDTLRAVAQEHNVPLFDRFAIMHQWQEQGDFDLFSTVHGPELAKRVHNCLGRALASFLIGAAHLGPAQQN